MPRSEQEHRVEIVHVGRLMFDKGWIAANDGNITVRLDNGYMLATPRGVSKGMLVQIERGNAPNGITRIDLELALDGSPASVPIVMSSG